MIESNALSLIQLLHFFFATVKNELVRVAKSVVASIATTQNG
jgi:hypothetical protein